MNKIQLAFEKGWTGMLGAFGGLYVSIQTQIYFLQYISLVIGIIIGIVTLFLKVKQALKK